jgi:hypothetical protein
VKSHPDVGERYYPDLLAKIREKEAEMDGQTVKSNGVPIVPAAA